MDVFKRGPGWVTNPEATRRIHAYWTKKGQPGYAKIGWGVPGDFNRCRIEVGEEIGENSPDKLAVPEPDLRPVAPRRARLLAGASHLR
jgi:hypothetical protein